MIANKRNQMPLTLVSPGWIQFWFDLSDPVLVWVIRPSFGLVYPS